MCVCVCVCVCVLDCASLRGVQTAKLREATKGFALREWRVPHSGLVPCHCHNTMLVGVAADSVPVPSTLVMSSILFATFGVVWSCKRLKRIAVTA